MNRDCSREWLKRLIEDRYPSVNDFAKEIKAAPRAVWYWIAGTRVPTMDNKAAIVRLLGNEAKRAFIAEDYGSPQPLSQDAS